MPFYYIVYYTKSQQKFAFGLLPKGAFPGDSFHI